jgi:hypothetical protein
MTDTATVAGIPQGTKPRDNAASEDEFAVLLRSGRIFYTGGFESIDSLKNTILRELEIQGKGIAGSFEPNEIEYYLVYIDHDSIEAILDLRDAA